MFEPVGEISLGDGVDDGADTVKQGIDRAPGGAAHQGFEFGEEQLDGIEVWAIRGEEEQGAACRFDQGADDRAAVRGEVVHDDNLALDQGGAQVFTHVPLEDQARHRAVQDEWGQWPHQTDRADQGVVEPVIAGHRVHGPEMTGRTGIATGHGGVEAAFVNEDQPLWLIQIRRQVIEERRTAFLRTNGPLITSPRIGITQAAELPLRFVLVGSGFISKKAS